MIVQANFNDFDLFHAHASQWELDFTMLGYNDFSAFLHLIDLPDFQVGHSKLQGLIHQQGQVPKGFRTLVLPVHNNVRFRWLNKEVGSSQVLIFPRSGELNSTSGDSFEVIVLSIREERLNDILELLGVSYRTGLFDNDEKYIEVSPTILKNLVHQLLHFLRQKDHFDLLNGKGISEAQDRLENICVHLLYHLTEHYSGRTVEKIRRRDLGLHLLLERLHKDPYQKMSMKEMQKFSGLSERTLEYAFIERFKVSPSQYQKAFRLNRFKRDLRSPADNSSSLRQIAARYGFLHMSQLGQDFKKHFGDTPSGYRKSRS